MPEQTDMHQRIEQLFRDFYNHGMEPVQAAPKSYNTAVNEQSTQSRAAGAVATGGKHDNKD